MGVFITVPYTLAAYIVRDFLGGDAAREQDVGRETGLLAAAASAAQVCCCCSSALLSFLLRAHVHFL
jgi:hypothetical protein